MLRLLPFLIVLFFSTSVEAHRHGRGTGFVTRSVHGRSSIPGMERFPAHKGRDLVTVQTAANIPITVASRLATSFQSLIADFVSAGYHPRCIHCFARSGHVTHSRHYAGAACDFDGSLSRSRFMRSAVADKLIRKHHLRNGCSFRVHGTRDCGHVDDGQVRHHRGHEW